MVVDGIYVNDVAKIGRNPANKHQIEESSWVWRMSGLTRNGTGEPEPVSRDYIFRREQGHRGRIIFPV